MVRRAPHQELFEKILDRGGGIAEGQGWPYRWYGSIKIPSKVAPACYGKSCEWPKHHGPGAND